MTVPEIVPFSAEHLDAAARLLARRHARQREAEPLLPADVDFRAQVEEEWSRDGASGAVALRGGEPVGYLIGAPSAQDNAGTMRIVAGLAGHAATEAEDARDLYAAAAASWADEGLTRHAVVVPAGHAALVDAWFRLAFGLQFVYAVRETAAETAADSGVLVRPGTPDDLGHVGRFDRLLWSLQAESPSFSGMTVGDEGEFRAEWSDLWDRSDEFTHFVAELGGRVVGHALLYRRPGGDVRVPEDGIDLAHAATDPEVRGSGAGLALTAHALGWAHENGYRAMTTDWRSVNLLSSRFWPRRGFRPTFFRLYRSVP